MAAADEYPFPKYGKRCDACGWEGAISAGHFCMAKCQHVAPLELPNARVTGPRGEPLRLRQCRDCWLLGAAEDGGETVWMRPVQLETKG